MRAVIGRPASYAALKTVVETWQTPPPSPVVSSPLMMTGASRKPLDALRSPVPARGLEGLRRRTRCLQGRCQGFYCLGGLVSLVARETGRPAAAFLEALA